MSEVRDIDLTPLVKAASELAVRGAEIVVSELVRGEGDKAVGDLDRTADRLEASAAQRAGATMTEGLPQMREVGPWPYGSPDDAHVRSKER